MKLYSENEHYKLYHGSMLDMLEVIDKNSIDSIVTDPPYELGFMNKGWDSSGIAFSKETWEKCLAALKPGGYLLAFGGSRTFHRIACAIEDAGFEIRDTIMWLYGSGFPKSMNIGLAIDKKNDVESEIIGESDCPNIKGNNYENNNGSRLIVQHKKALNKWNGWGTALKPSYEPIIVARKPCEGSTTDNVLKYGVGGINIDECRIGNETIKGGTAPSFRDIGKKSKEAIGIDKLSFGQVQNAERIEYPEHTGRFPANVIFTYDNNDFEEVCGGMPVGGKNGNITKNYKMNNQVYGEYGYCNTFDTYNDSGSAARYFYCAKASNKDRDEGLDKFETQQCTGGGGGIGDYLNDVNSASGKFGSEKAPHKNTHPTVKPTELMQYLIRLVTPNGGTILDPFNGSGSTGKAAMWENRERNKGYKYIGIEITESYLPIARARIEYALVSPTEEQQEQIPGQISLFDLYKTGE